jgi:mono/diheme cytochrome c family protein
MKPLGCWRILALAGVTLWGCTKHAPEVPMREPRWKLEDFGGVLSVGLEGYRDFEQGERLFAQSACASCHEFGPYMQTRHTGPSLKSKALQYTPEEALGHILSGSWHLREKQPILEDLEQAQILDLLAYLLSGARKDSPFFNQSN